MPSERKRLPKSRSAPDGKERWSSVSTPKGIEFRSRLLFDITPSMNQKELPSTPVFSPINRKYATVTPHPGKGARKEKIKPLSPMKTLSEYHTPKSIKGDLTLPKIFVDDYADVTVHGGDVQNFVTANATHVFPGLDETNLEGLQSQRSSSCCESKIFDLNKRIDDMKIEFTALKNDEQKQKVADLELLVNELKDNYTENLAKEKCLVDELREKLKEMEISQQVAQDLLTSVTLRLDFLESLQQKPGKNPQNSRKKMRTSSLSDIPQISDDSDIRNRTRSARQRLPRVEKRPTTVPKPFSFVMREEMRVNRKTPVGSN